jgi:hypothetical protein
MMYPPQNSRDYYYFLRSNNLLHQIQILAKIVDKRQVVTTTIKHEINKLKDINDGFKNVFTNKFSMYLIIRFHNKIIFNSIVQDSKKIANIYLKFNKSHNDDNFMRTDS